MHKNLKFSKKTRSWCASKPAFSMSEVTIVLAIIGVIAVLCIGALKFSIKSQYPTMRAVFKNDLATALATMNTEENLSSITDTDTFVEKFNKYYNLKANTDADFASQYKDANGDVVNFKTYDYSFKTDNGTSVRLSFVDQGGADLSKFVSDNSVINFSKESYEISNAALNYVTGYFDVNGSKGPNKIGEDVGLIMPAFALNKANAQYFTTDSSGNFIVKSANGSTPDITLVGSDGKFDIAAANANSNKSTCESGSNYITDDYGDCNICSLTKAYCENDGKKLNKANCQCEYNVSCPKNQIQDSTGNCICKTAKPTLPSSGVFAIKDSNGPIWDEESCSYKCELGAPLKCIANGGTWNNTTCSCSCGIDTDSNSAAGKCLAKSGGTGYARAEANDYCACHCNEALFNAKVKAKENPNNVADYNYSTLFVNDLSQKCFTCAESPDKETTIVKNDDENNKGENYGFCTTNCAVSNYATWTAENQKFYQIPDGTKNLENKAGQCSPKCVLTDSYCKNYFKEHINNSNNSCDKFTHFNTCSRTQYTYNCDSENEISVVADRDTCTCKIAGYGNFVPNNTYGFVCHGACGYNVGWRCKMTRKGSMDINANNPYAAKQTKITDIYTGESCANNYDPILMILPYSNNASVSNIPPMKNGKVVVYPDSSKNSTQKETTWLASQNKETASYFMLVKKSNIQKNTIINAENTMFTDMVYDTGIDELKAKYDTNHDGFVNELDSNTKDLVLWADYNADAQIADDEIITNKPIIEISTIVSVVSDITGAAMESDKAVYSLRGQFKAGYPIESKDSKYIWVKRVPVSAHDQIEYIYYSTEAVTDPSSGATTTKQVEYRYILSNNKYRLIDNTGKIDNTGTNDPLANKTNIKAYYEANGKTYEVRTYELMDILFKEKTN